MLFAEYNSRDDSERYRLLQVIFSLLKLLLQCGPYNVTLLLFVLAVLNDMFC